MIVSIKVSTIAHIPCWAGWSIASACACKDADKPRPASLENTPLASPFLTAVAKAAPAKPPTAAVPVKAPLKIAPRTVPIFPTFAITIIRVAARYIILINGTSQSEIATRPFIPPKRTTAIKITMMIQETKLGTFKDARLELIAEPCTRQIVHRQTSIIIPNATASGIQCKPSLMYIKGPPR